MRRYSGDPFRLEVLTEESFVDGVFTISVIVIRLSCTAKTEWVIANDTERARSLYGIDKEEYLAMKEAQLQAWEEKIIAKLECPPDISYTITRAQGDIFTVVITEMTGGPKATAPARQGGDPDRQGRDPISAADGPQTLHPDRRHRLATEVRTRAGGHR